MPQNHCVMLTLSNDLGAFFQIRVPLPFKITTSVIHSTLDHFDPFVDCILKAAPIHN